MKKWPILIIVLVLALCALLVVGGGATWYIFFRESPQKAFEEALNALSEGDYYQYDTNTDVTIEEM